MQICVRRKKQRTSYWNEVSVDGVVVGTVAHVASGRARWEWRFRWAGAEWNKAIVFPSVATMKAYIETEMGKRDEAL